MIDEVRARPRISLVIPAYNEERLLPACLEAVTSNVAGRVLEVIVVDNGSTDDTPNIVARHDWIRCVHEPEKGITRARQSGFEAASGDVIAFVDADTRPPPGWIEQIEAAFTSHEDLACLSGPYTFYDLTGLRSAVSRWWFVAAAALGHITGHLLVGGNFAIRRSVLDSMGGFDRTIGFYGEDVDIGRRATRHGRILFSRTLIMPTSGRRMTMEGFGRIATIYLANYLSIVWRGRPITRAYRDIR
jgi:glycosyltransferase involved in cell wall biosynthesis